MTTIQVRRIVRDSVRSYFAPVTGAIKGMRLEMRRADKKAQQHRSDANQQKTKHNQTL